MSCLKNLLGAYEKLKDGDRVRFANCDDVVTVIQNKIGDCVFFKSEKQMFHVFYEEIDLKRDEFKKVSE